MSDRRLIEAAFPLQRVSEDSVHEKNVRHGHISTLHIWPARRPLAASRAVILSTLLPDPGDEAGRGEALRRMAGYWVEIRDEEGEVVSKVWRDGIFHWGSENEEELERFRGEIRKAFSGRAPRVLDPFAGGGAIPLEAMRLGCEVEAADLNPVAWFILRCTLHYPTLVAGKSLPIPEIGSTGPAVSLAGAGPGSGDPAEESVPTTTEGHPALWRSDETPEPRAFPDHLREWGYRVLDGARRELASHYPTYADFEPVRRKGRRRAGEAKEIPYERRPMQLLEPDRNGAVWPALGRLNGELESDYLVDERKPRWVEKPTVAYLWARTVECAGCRAEIPLLKTRWLCRKSGKRVLLTMAPREDGAGVVFGVDHEAAEGEGNAAARREHDRRLGAGTMSRRGATCPRCGAVATMRDLRAAGRAGRLGERMTAVVVNGQRGKEYRLPTEAEIKASRVTEDELEALYADVPFGLPAEPTPKAGIGASRAFSVDGYGFDTWRKLFTNRQLLAIGTLIRQIRQCADELGGYKRVWRESLWMSLACALSKFTDYSSSICVWHNSGEKLGHTYARFALPIMWDYCEVSPVSEKTGGFIASVEWVARVQERLCETGSVRPPSVQMRSAAEVVPGEFDLICTDPPYYDAIPYSDLMDFFHIWLRRTLHGVSEETDRALADPLGPKWDNANADGELIDDANRFDGSREASKNNYEDGMARCFGRFRTALRDDGRFVVVFASKDPNAWETLVSAIIRAGFVVTASWPIQTEMQTRQRSFSSAALASSIWLVCRKRPAAARAGWDNRVLSEMRTNITTRLRDFWDAGLRGPDFVWAATGPALEAFSRHPFVRKADSTKDETMSVAEFLKQVRRMVVGFAVGRLLRLTGKPPSAAGDTEAGADDTGPAADDGRGTEALDDLTTYYLLHRNDFGLEPAPAGACILYALSCGLSDSDLAGRLDLLSRKQGRGEGEDEGEDEGREGGPSSGDKARLKQWNRRRRDVGRPGADGSPPPLVDCVHQAMRLWEDGDRGRVDAYLNERGLPHNELFRRVVQAVLELAEKGSDERRILESLQQHEPSDAAAAPLTSTRPRGLFS